MTITVSENNASESANLTTLLIYLLRLVLATICKKLIYMQHPIATFKEVSRKIQLIDSKLKMILITFFITSSLLDLNDHIVVHSVPN